MTSMTSWRLGANPYDHPRHEGKVDHSVTLLQPTLARIDLELGKSGLLHAVHTSLMIRIARPEGVPCMPALLAK
jgi:hypothetical protein